MFTLIFYLGAIFIRDNNLDVAKVLTTIYSMFAGMTVDNKQFMPNLSTAKNSATNFFEILDSEDEDRFSPHLQSYTIPPFSIISLPQRTLFLSQRPNSSL
jgi:hypothetical protein